jgi:predicted nucleic acid-binding protein
VIVVADAGPLLHLFWIDAASWALPPQTIDVVQAVWEEVQSRALMALQDPRLRNVVEPVAVSPLLAPWSLDHGELVALSYAIASRPHDEVLVLCDELAARRACQAVGLPVVGSIGLISESYRAGRVSLEQAEAALRDLPGRGRPMSGPSSSSSL